MPEVARSAIGQWGRFRPDGFTVLLAALSGLGVALVMAREITRGVVLYPDSLQYIAAARNLLAGEGLSGMSGWPLTWWPPLYPLLLAAASMGAWDPLDVAGPVNAAVFGLTIFVVGRYLRQRLASRFLAVWACLAVVLSIPLVELASTALSGPLFILLATLALVRIDKYLVEGRLSILVWAAVFSALAWQTRYIGVAVPLFVGLLLLFQPGTPLMQRARRIAVFSLVAALPTVLWMVRNYLLAGKGVGNYRPIDYTLPTLLRDVLDLLWVGWLGLDRRPPVLWPSLEWLPAASALLLLAAVLVASAGWMFARISHGRQVTLPAGAHHVFGGFAVVYFILLITALMLGQTHHGVEARYLGPLYIPLLVAAVGALDRLLVRERRRKPRGSAGGPPVLRIGRTGRVEVQRPLAAVLTMVLSLWMLGQVPPSVDLIFRAISGDLYRGLNVPRWANSETLRYIRENPIDGWVYTTEPYVVYLHTNRTGFYSRPATSRPTGHAVDEYHFAPGTTGQEQFRQWLADVPDGAYVIWFYNSDNNRLYDYSAADMRGAPELEPVAEMADGVIFRIDRSDTPRSNPHLSAYASIVSGDAGAPAVRSTFDIRLDGATLTYLKEPCVAEDVAAKFFLHLVPLNEIDLSAASRHHESNFNNLDFTFPQHGAIWDGKCLGVVTLPDYEIARIRTGQYISGEGKLWRADFIPPQSPGVAAYRTAYRSLLASDGPAARSVFDVYLDDGTVYYVRESCNPEEDTAARFFLHVAPVDVADLPASRRPFGFENRDSPFALRGEYFDGMCMTRARLPDYPIAHIRTGQFVRGEGQVWRIEIAGPSYPPRESAGSGGS